jgi:hypothetical protein
MVHVFNYDEEGMKRFYPYTKRMKFLDVRH